MNAFFKRTGLYLWRQVFRPLALAAAIVFPIKSAIADWNWVPTGSMKPTILEGELILVNKLAYDLKIPFTLTRVGLWDHPGRGDIVVFFSPHDGRRLVKRVVGVPGDTLEMRNNVLWRNGRKLDYQISPAENFGREFYEDANPVLARESDEGSTRWVATLPGRPALRNFGPLTIPAGKYFMMGDSRDNSFDSRFFGLVERRQIVGKAHFVVASLDKGNSYVPRLGRWLSSLYLPSN